MLSSKKSSMLEVPVVCLYKPKYWVLSQNWPSVFYLQITKEENENHRMDVRLKKKEVATLTDLPSILPWLKLERWWQSHKLREGENTACEIKLVAI